MSDSFTKTIRKETADLSQDIHKYIRKGKPEKIQKKVRKYFEEIGEEARDFLEDYREQLTDRKPTYTTRKKQAIVGGLRVSVRPAYIFAERIDNMLRVLFGISIVLSALTATIVGFPTLSTFLNFLVYSFAGRAVMFVIGSSYLTIAVWKLLHLKDTQ